MNVLEEIWNKFSFASVPTDYNYASHGISFSYLEIIA